MKIQKVPASEASIHPKTWGYEIWIENRPEYCGKRLIFFPGGKSSMHFHLKKCETMYLVDGMMIVDLIDPETTEKYSIQLFPGDSLFIPQGQLHQLINLGVDSILEEFSTTHEDSDSYRAYR